MDMLDEEQIGALQKAFDSFDTDNKGYITPETVGVILRMMGVKISEKNLQEVIAETDEDGSGELEFEEFVELAAKFLIEEDEEALKAELKEAFRVYDREGNGYITTEVLREILRELDNRLTEEDLDNIIEEVDEDGSGTLDFDGVSTPACLLSRGGLLLRLWSEGRLSGTTPYNIHHHNTLLNHNNFVLVYDNLTKDILDE
ncbi:hypothetical protein OTU49_009023, partial [Cherax quadricarinatus]